MNLDKLFAAQKVLRDHIGYNEPDRCDKLILALSVELGECANEWRGFKFWSKDQSPRTQKARAPYVDLDDADFYNPLLEEFVDCLHFILELGIERKVEFYAYEAEIWKEEDITTQFIKVYQDLTTFQYDEAFYLDLLNRFIGLGKMLGFAWEDIEQAYFTKNQVNHERQNNGY